MNKLKLIRITTVPLSLEKLLENQLGFMSNYYDVVAVSSDKKRLQAFGKENEIKTFHIELTRKITPLKDLKSLWSMYLFLRKEKPFIVHSHTPKAGTIGMLAAKLAGIPNRLHTVAGLPLLEAKGIKRKLLNIVERITYAAATAVYPNSIGLKNIILEESFCSSDKLFVIGQGSSNGINAKYFNVDQVPDEDKNALRKTLKISENDFVFIFVGRLVNDKGINELINAFQNVRAQFDNVKLLLVGSLESDLDPLMPATLQKMMSDDHIVSVGFQRDVRPYFAISNALVFPSYREGFPNAVMQAGAMDLPVIVSNINGCNEIVEEGRNGLIIAVKNSDAIEHAMLKLLKNKVLYDRLKQNARHMIVTKYEQRIIWESLLAEYKRLERNI